MFSMVGLKDGGRDACGSAGGCHCFSSTAAPQIHWGCSMNLQRRILSCTCVSKVKDHVACSAEIPSAKVPLKPKCCLLCMHGIAVLLKPTSCRYRRLRVSKILEGLELQIWEKRKRITKKTIALSWIPILKPPPSTTGWSNGARRSADTSAAFCPVSWIHPACWKFRFLSHEILLASPFLSLKPRAHLCLLFSLHTHGFFVLELPVFSFLISVENWDETRVKTRLRYKL